MGGPFDLNRDGHISPGEAGFAAGFIGHLMNSGEGGNGAGGGGGRGGCLKPALILLTVLLIIIAVLAIAYATATTSYNTQRAKETAESHSTTDSYSHRHEQYLRLKELEEEFEAATPPEPKPDDLAEKLPYTGMNADWIAETWLGPADEIDTTPIDGGAKKGAITYYWKARNGTNDTVFAAYVRDGEVIDVSKYYFATDYWPDLWGPPDLYATGKPRKSVAQSSRPPDPSDYDDAEDYADDASDYFAKQGYEDPWGAAVEYWDENY